MGDDGEQYITLWGTLQAESGGQNGGRNVFGCEITLKTLGETVFVPMFGVQKVRGSNPLGPTIAKVRFIQ